MKIEIEVTPETLDDMFLAELKESLAYVNQLIVDGQNPDSLEHRDLEDNKELANALKVVARYYGDA